MGSPDCNVTVVEPVLKSNIFFAIVTSQLKIEPLYQWQTQVKKLNERVYEVHQ